MNWKYFVEVITANELCGCGIACWLQRNMAEFRIVIGNTAENFRATELLFYSY